MSLIIGFRGWVIGMIAAAVAFRRAGAGRPIVALVGLSALFAVHPPPVGPVGLVCFAAAAVLVERWRDETRVRRDDAASPVVTPEALSA